MNLPVEAVCEPGFWFSFSKRKLTQLKLDEGEIEIDTQLSELPTASGGKQHCIEFVSECSKQRQLVPAVMLNVNTMERFKALPISSLQSKHAQRIYDDVCSDVFLSNPAVSLRVFLATFADLKSNKFFYWPLIPTLSWRTTSGEPFRCVIKSSRARQSNSNEAAAPMLISMLIPLQPNTRIDFDQLSSTATRCTLSEFSQYISNHPSSHFAVCIDDSLSTASQLSNFSRSLIHSWIVAFWDVATRHSDFSVVLGNVTLEIEAPIGSRCERDHIEVFGWLNRSGSNRLGPRMMDLSKGMSPALYVSH